MSLARNAASGAGRYAVGVVFAIVVSPYAYHTLGADRFGVWALGGVVLTWARLLDLGLNRALVWRVARAVGDGDAPSAVAALATARRLALGLAGLTVGATWLAAGMVVARVLGVPPDLRAEATTAIVGTAVVAAIETACAPWQAALDGAGRMDLSNAVDAVVQRVASPLGVLVVLGAGWGISGLVAKNIAAALAAGGLYRLLLRRAMPAWAGIAGGWDGTVARDLLAFGRHAQAVTLASALVEPAAKTLLSREAGLAAVAAYEIAARVTGQAAGMVGALAGALFPAAAARGAAGRPTDRAALVALYRRAMPYHAWVVWPTYAVLVALAGPFVAAWLGPGRTDVADGIVLLGAGWAIAVASLPAFHVAQAGGRPGLSTAGGLTTAGIAVAAAALLVDGYGYRGVVGGVALGLAAGGFVVLALFARAFGLSPVALGVVPWRVAVAAGVAAAMARWGSAHLPAGLWAAVAAGAAGMAAAAGVLVVTGAVSAGDRARAVDLARRVSLPAPLRRTSERWRRRPRRP